MGKRKNKIEKNCGAGLPSESNVVKIDYLGAAEGGGEIITFQLTACKS